MTKAAFSLACSVILCAAIPTVHAQTTPVDAAVQEAVHRQADTITLRQKLVEAQATAQKDPEAAAKLYDEAWNLVERIGSGIPTETAQTKVGLAAVRMELASAAQKRGDLKAADVNVKDILRVDPNNAAAVEFKRQNDKLLAAQRGRIPSDDTLSKIPNIEAGKVNASTLVQDGKVLYELGKLDDAETKLKQALAIDPQNYEATYYIALIQQALNKQATQRRNITSDQRMVQIEQAWSQPVKRDALPVPNPYAHTNLIYTSKGRQAIISKLDRIRLDNVMYDGLPLSEVVRNLSEEAKKRDPEKRGINFIINPNAEAAVSITNSAGAGGAGGGPGFPPGFGGGGGEGNGLPVVSAPPEAVDVGSIAIRLNPGLSDVRLADVLDAICKVADKPIKYSIEDYAVVFSLKGTEQAPLYIRTYRVDPNTFYQGLEAVGALSFGNITTGSGGSGGGGGGGGGGQNGQNQGLSLPQVFVAGIAQGSGGGGGGGGGSVGGGGGGGNNVGLSFVTRTNSTLAVQEAVRIFFSTMGVDLNPPKSVFFNDRSGILLVRATLQDLDVIEAAVQALNVAPPMINIKTRFAEISQNDAKALGFDWYLGNFLMGNQSVGLQGGNAPSYTTPPTAANPTGVFPSSGILPSGSDQLITSGLRNLYTPSGSTTSQSVPSLFTLTGLLTDPQFRTVIHALEQRNGVNLLNAPELTTLSGRQAQVQVIDVQTIVTGVNANQTSSGGTAGTTGTGGGGAVGSTITYTEQPLPFGPVLDVVPYVCADGYTIQMTIIPTYTQFLGYDDPGGFAVQAQSIGSSSVASGTLSAALPLPHFRVRQVTTSAIVWDGQTVVLGGLISENVTRQKDKVPFLGDIPWLGTLFQSQQNISQKNNLMIFVTPTIIDPAGNRYHTDDEMPFAQGAVPPQQPLANE